MKRKLTTAVLAATTIVGALSLPSSPVHAGADASNGDIIGIVGSDTTYYVMSALVDAHNLSWGVAANGGKQYYNPNKDKAVNIPPLVSMNASVEAGEATVATSAWLKDARLAWPGGAVLPADANCTTQYVFGGVGSNDADTNNNVTSAGDVAYTDVTSIPGAAGVTVRMGVIPPNGSGAGRTAISGGTQTGVNYNSAGNGFACLDMGRSSSFSADATKYEYWAFALDAIGWTYFPGNTHTAASNGLTNTDLNKIYSCSNATLDANNDGDTNDVGDRKNGYPIYRFWGDITGDATDVTPIKPYRIQQGSGTGDDVARYMLGKGSSGQNTDATFLANCDSATNNTDGDAATTYTFPIVQEHDCRNVSDANKPDAICFYGYSRWVLQARSLETDKRNGAVFGKYGTSASSLLRPSFSSINDTATRYAGTRYVYNVLPLNASADVARSADVRRFAGVTPLAAGCASAASNGVVSEVTASADCNLDGDTLDTAVPATAQPGFICGDATARRIIASFGFKPLTSGVTDASSGSYGSSYCRRNPVALL